ncbi:hypothetical protein QTH97_33280 [Variovorax sp. J22R24]|uniref:hypothetical protein n=1 Tax=Variovorax gracilis TaxID=3053502 RepID=UPI002576E104|nr:hypothetical protein [Variovorax sp. J22R24]MDM0109830.1 hypothetical protein [Variovorax sp. J22R24]
MTTRANAEPWAYVPVKAILRIFRADAAIAATWEQFAQPDAEPPGIPGHAIVVAVIPRGSASPMLDLVRGAQRQPFRMSCKAAADEGYSFLAPPSVIAVWHDRKEAEAEERRSQASIVATENASFGALLESANPGMKERELAESAYRKYGRGASNLRIRRSRRLSHCMRCREELDSEVHILECKHCTAIVCPACGACGCGDGRFDKQIK